MSATPRLSERDGLPEALRFLVAHYPREAWEGHPNFSEMTRFWLERHTLFRGLQAQLAGDAAGFFEQTIEPRAFAAAVAQTAGFFVGQLQTHHQMEDHHYFPRLLAVEPRLARAFELLDGDHHELHAALEALVNDANHVLRAVSERADPHDAAGRYRDRVSAFQTFLDRHLTDEEEVVVPIVLHHAFQDPSN